MKQEVVNDLSTRYQDTCTKKDLTVATLLDPLFKSTPFLSDKDRLDAYHEMTVQAVLAVSAVKSKATVKGEISEPPLPATPETPALPTFPDECDDDLPTSPAKKLRQETDETISVKANPTAMSSLWRCLHYKCTTAKVISGYLRGRGFSVQERAIHQP